MSKRGQVTIFIIIAIVIAAVLLVVFYPRIKIAFVPSTPSIRLQDCVEDKLKETVQAMAKRGGSVEPENSIMYNDEKVEYLCYTNQYYKTCVMQQPLLKQHMETGILEEITPTVKSCMESMKENLAGKGYSVSGAGEEISVEIVPENIKVAVSGISFVKADTGESYEKFEIKQKSKLYDLIILTTNILNWEARYGDFDIASQMLIYPSIKVEKYKQGDGSKIYMLTDRLTGESFTFASRSLSWPAGYGFGQEHVPS
ncbi:MAG: hypothetical protein AABX71_02790 [Nanoarchaeota archaeon]